MAYIFKSIAATQFISSMLFYLFVNCNIFKFSQLLFNVQVSNGYFIATFSETVKNHTNISQTVRDRAISSEFFDPQSSTRVSYSKGGNFNFCHFWQPSWILAENENV